MKLLLVTPPYCKPGEDLVTRSVDYAGNNPPLGLLSIASYLRKHNYDVKVINMFKYTSWDEVQKTLINEKYDIFGVSIWTGNHFKAKKILEIVKGKESKIITMAGSPHATVLDEQIVENYPVDFVVRGEGEETTSIQIPEVLISSWETKNTSLILKKAFQM